jgi:hypothetical protein
MLADEGNEKCVFSKKSESKKSVQRQSCGDIACFTDNPTKLVIV